MNNKDKNLVGCIFIVNVCIAGFIALYVYLSLSPRIDKLEVMRSGVPFASIPLGDRTPWQTTNVMFGSIPCKAIYYKSTSRGKASADDIIFLVDKAGIVLAAWSLDLDSGRDAERRLIEIEPTPTK